jgi:hypothetical protein
MEHFKEVRIKKKNFYSYIKILRRHNTQHGTQRDSIQHNHTQLNDMPACPTCPPAFLPVILPTPHSVKHCNDLPPNLICLSVCLPSYPPACPPAHLPAQPSACMPTRLLSCNPATFTFY